MRLTLTKQILTTRIIVTLSIFLCTSLSSVYSASYAPVRAYVPRGKGPLFEYYQEALHPKRATSVKFNRSVLSGDLVPEYKWAKRTPSFICFKDREERNTVPVYYKAVARAQEMGSLTDDQSALLYVRLDTQGEKELRLAQDVWAIMSHSPLFFLENDTERSRYFSFYKMFTNIDSARIAHWMYRSALCCGYKSTLLEYPEGDPLLCYKSHHTSVMCHCAMGDEAVCPYLATDVFRFARALQYVFGKSNEYLRAICALATPYYDAQHGMRVRDAVKLMGAIKNTGLVSDCIKKDICCIIVELIKSRNFTPQETLETMQLLDAGYHLMSSHGDKVALYQNLFILLRAVSDERKYEMVTGYSQMLADPSVPYDIKHKLLWMR